MSQKIIPIASILAISSIGYFLFKPFRSDKGKLSRAQLVQIIIQLRKHIFSTLREIAYVANYLNVVDSDLEPKKIKEIIMRDGGTGLLIAASAQAKLNSIEKLILDLYGVSRQRFEQSCNEASHHDLEIKMLLEDFKNSIQLALQGTVESYNGSIPQLTCSDAIKIYREVTLRRMKIIEQKFVNKIHNEQCVKMEFQIQQYLESEGIFNTKQSSQKIFLTVLQYHYKHDSGFKEQFQALEHELEEFIQEIKNRKSEKNTQKHK